MRPEGALLRPSTGNLRARQLLRGETKTDGTAGDQGRDITDALTLAKGMDLQQTGATGGSVAVGPKRAFTFPDHAFKASDSPSR